MIITNCVAGQNNIKTVLFFYFQSLAGSDVFIEKLLVPEILKANDIHSVNFQALILDTIINYDETDNSQEIPAHEIFSLVSRSQIR